MRRRRPRVLPIVGLFGGALASGFGALSAIAADFELGRHLSTECVTCHRTASAQGAIPNIYGLTEPTFAQVMQAYRDKKLANQVMQNIAARLSDADIAALAHFFATTRKPN